MDKFDSFDALIGGITPDIYRKLREAVALGKWENGDKLTAEQTEHCLQAIIAWDHRHLPEQERVGYIDRAGKDRAGKKGERAGGEGRGS